MPNLLVSVNFYHFDSIYWNQVVGCSDFDFMPRPCVHAIPPPPPVNDSEAFEDVGAPPSRDEGVNMYIAPQPRWPEHVQSSVNVFLSQSTQWATQTGKRAPCDVLVHPPLACCGRAIISECNIAISHSYLPRPARRFSDKDNISML